MKINAFRFGAFSELKQTISYDNKLYKMHSELPTLLQIISESDNLSNFILELAYSPTPLRIKSLNQIISEMRNSKESEATIQLFSSLLDPTIFDAFVSALKDEIQTEQGAAANP